MRLTPCALRLTPYALRLSEPRVSSLVYEASGVDTPYALRLLGVDTPYALRLLGSKISLGALRLQLRL
jgi:hypothetical protein